MYPKSEFEGIDLSPIQLDFVPENVQFVVDDFEHEGGWTYSENHYIHMRHTIHSTRDRLELFKRSYEYVEQPSL